MRWNRQSNHKIKVVLVQPPVDGRFGGIDMTFKRLAPSSGLSILSCETERRLNATFDISIYCPAYLSDDLIHTFAECDILGISTWFSNYENGILIASMAKEINPELLIIFGGVNATNLGQRVLLNRSGVDLVVCDDGEDVLWRIIAGHDYSLIPNLWYRNENGMCVFTEKQHINLNSIGLWDFRHTVDARLEDYDSRNPEYQFDPELPPIGLSMTRGCLKATKQHKRCDYCSISYKGLRVTKSEKVWMQIQHLQELYGIETFFETGDDFTLDSYAHKLNALKPSNIPFKLRIYASPWSLTNECVDALSKLGVYEIFVGVETADNIISNRAGHCSTKEDVINSLERLEKAGISVCIPFLFGLPGETVSSVHSTVNFANELVDKYSNIRMMLISLAIPLIGSTWFNRLSSDEAVCTAYKKTGGNLETDDVLNYYYLLELSLQSEGAVSMGELIDALEIMREQLKDRVLVGCFGGIEVMQDAIPGNCG